MITKMWIEEQTQIGGEGLWWFTGVETDNGGDQDFGQYYSREAALSSLRNIVEEHFDEEWNEGLLEERVLDESADT